VFAINSARVHSVGASGAADKVAGMYQLARQHGFEFVAIVAVAEVARRRTGRAHTGAAATSDA
jgi:hypothetical protein